MAFPAGYDYSPGTISFIHVGGGGGGMVATVRSRVRGLLVRCDEDIAATGGDGTRLQFRKNGVSQGQYFRIPEGLPAGEAVYLEPELSHDLLAESGDLLELLSDGLQIAVTDVILSWVTQPS